MHVDEVSTDVDLVRGLLAAQFREWASLPLERVPSHGTDNALYRLGDDMVVRLPRIGWAVSGLQRELEWLPRLAPRLPVEIPVPLATGTPENGYPWPWAVYRWLGGENPSVARTGDRDSLARDVVALIRGFRQIDLEGPPCRRGLPLLTQDDAARAALDELEGEIDVAAATAAWETALGTPDWPGPPTWVHGDLLPGNMLVREQRLTGVLDFGLVGVGDPACDLIAAWGVLPSRARVMLREELGVDDATWARGRGWALSLGLIALPYYKDTNPGFADVARHLIGEVLAET
jgi:aminoglycoside phosphotransferase (APT) family kinase protein